MRNCLLYYITDRQAFSGDESSRRRRLLEKIREAARAGVDFIQLREKDLSTRDLELLAKQAVCVISEAQPHTALLINSRTDVALAVGAAGVHLRSDDIAPQELRAAWNQCEWGSRTLTRRNSTRLPVIAVSCHSATEVNRAAASGATFAVFAPIFEKKDAAPVGLDRLHEACQTNMPVLALGGITLTNARSCLIEGAAGIAGVRLFQENDIAAVAQQLRASS